MFSLIITIISIALVAALAIASIYYGGDAFSQGTAKANASTLVAQAQQISAANTLYKNDHGGLNAGDVAALVTGNYLQSAPVIPATVDTNASGWALNANGQVTAVIENAEVCAKVNEQLGSTDGTPVANAQYSCTWDANTGAFLYK